MESVRRLSFLLSLIILLFQISCATRPTLVDKNRFLAYRVETTETKTGLHMPVFVIEEPNQSHNQIGTPQARLRNEARPLVFVDPGQASVYTETRHFTTASDSYTNLIYRVHFESVPFFHLTWGDNVGLLVIVTLNSLDQPVLYTTVHACGCYLAFIPTTFLDPEAYPDNWENERQTVLGEILPGRLDYSAVEGQKAVTVVFVRKNTHRVMEVMVTTWDYLQGFPHQNVVNQPMILLDQLPLETGGTTSFFETSGARRGYVKESTKPWERLLMSWWAFDWRVGEDKRLGRGPGDGPIFYTSLKPWDRKDSDMRSFPDFLAYWGWDL